MAINYADLAQAYEPKGCLHMCLEGPHTACCICTGDPIAEQCSVCAGRTHTLVGASDYPGSDSWVG